jgi:hypothetical protein
VFGASPSIYQSAEVKPLDLVLDMEHSHFKIQVVHSLVNSDGLDHFVAAAVMFRTAAAACEGQLSFSCFQSLGIFWRVWLRPHNRKGLALSKQCRLSLTSIDDGYRR